MEQQEIDIIQELIDYSEFRKLVSACKSDECLFLEEAQVLNQYKKEDLVAAAHIIRSQEKDESPKIDANKKRIWKAVEIAADEIDRMEKKQDMRVNKGGKLWTTVLRYAAVFAGVLLVATWLMLDNRGEKNSPDPVLMVSKANPSGQKSRIQLVDGSVVHLNAESELRYEEGFNEKERRIHLKGEAYFEVAKDKARPFTVVSGGLEITALGTEFNVNAYDTEVAVALLEGSVVVNDPKSDEKITMEPMDVVAYNTQAVRLQKTKANAENLALWRKRVICFEDTPFDEAVKILARWYAADIEVQTAPAKPVTCAGKFDNSSLEIVLKNLGFTLGFDYEIDGKNVKINFNN